MQKIMLTLAAATVGCLLIGGCVTKSNPAHTEVYYPGVGKVDYHCPPGQRKKGNC